STDNRASRRVAVVGGCQGEPILRRVLAAGRLEELHLGGFKTLRMCSRVERHAEDRDALLVFDVHIIMISDPPVGSVDRIQAWNAELEVVLQFEFAKLATRLPRPAVP